MTGADRCAGVVRYELASLEDLEREQLIALRLHAMNREQYPRFFRGTYRLCMSLEMIADPELHDLQPGRGAGHPRRDPRHPLPGGPDRRSTGAGSVTSTSQAGTTGPSVLSHELRETLLDAAQRELRAIRRQLSFPVVAWNTFWRRDERTVWKPHWRLATRQAFRDGVCVAELLVAVKHRLNEKYLVERRRRRATGAARRAGGGRARRGLVERLLAAQGAARGGGHRRGLDGGPHRPAGAVRRLAALASAGTGRRTARRPADRPAR